MKREDLLLLHQTICGAARGLMTAKNHDYAGAKREQADPFANFRLAEAARLCTAEQGVLVRMTDKLSRLATFCESGALKVKGEGVADTVLDLVNYSVLFAGIVAERHGLNVPGGPDPRTVYLAGPITGHDADFAWRGTAAGMLEAAGLKVLSPVRGQVREKIGEDGYTYGESDDTSFVDRDVADVVACGTILANFPYLPERQSIGSFMELGMASALNRRVFVAGPDEVIRHPFPRHLFGEGRLFGKLEDAVAALVEEVGDGNKQS